MAAAASAIAFLSPFSKSVFGSITVQSSGTANFIPARWDSAHVMPSGASVDAGEGLAEADAVALAAALVPPASGVPLPQALRPVAPSTTATETDARTRALPHMAPTVARLTGQRGAEEPGSRWSATRVPSIVVRRCRGRDGGGWRRRC